MPRPHNCLGSGKLSRSQGAQLSSLTLTDLLLRQAPDGDHRGATTEWPYFGSGGRRAAAHPLNLSSPHSRVTHGGGLEHAPEDPLCGEVRLGLWLTVRYSAVGECACLANTKHGSGGSVDICLRRS
jgi:hypothetical protein